MLAFILKNVIIFPDSHWQPGDAMPYRFEILFSGPLGEKFRKEAEDVLRSRLRIETIRSSTVLKTGKVNAIIVEAYLLQGPDDEVDSTALLARIPTILHEWGKVPLVASVDMRTRFVDARTQTSMAAGELRKLTQQYLRTR